MNTTSTKTGSTLVVLLALVATLIGGVVLAGPAVAGKGGNGNGNYLQTGGGGETATVTLTETSTSTTPGTSTGGSSMPTGPYQATRNLEACNVANNSPVPIIGAVETAVGCVLNAALCTGDQRYMWQDTATFQGGQQQTPWQRNGGSCVAPGTQAGPVITVQAVIDAATVQAPVAPPHVEPGTRSYVNIPNNYWTTSATSTRTVNVLGTPIQVTFVPQTTWWQFGDGSGADGSGVRGAQVGQQGAVEHSYARSGSYDITTTTSYQVSFAIPGAGSQTVSLTSPQSPAVTLPVGEIQTQVDETG